MALDTIPEVPESEASEAQVGKAENAPVAAFHQQDAMTQMRERLRLSVMLGARAFYPYTAPEAKVDWLTRCVRLTLADGRTVLGALIEVAYSVGMLKPYLSIITDFDEMARETAFIDEIVALYPPRPDAHLLAFSGRAPRARKSADGQPARERKPRTVGPRIANVIDLNQLFAGGSVDLNELQALLNKHRAKIDAQPAAQPASEQTDDDDARDDPYADDPEVQAVRASMAVNRAAADRDERVLASSMDDYNALTRGETVDGVTAGAAVVVSPADAAVVYATDDAAMDAAFEAPITFVVDDGAAPTATAKVTKKAATAAAPFTPAPKPSAKKARGK